METDVSPLKEQQTFSPLTPSSTETTTAMSITSITLQQQQQQQPSTPSTVIDTNLLKNRGPKTDIVPSSTTTTNTDLVVNSTEQTKNSSDDQCPLSSVIETPVTLLNDTEVSIRTSPFNNDIVISTNGTLPKKTTVQDVEIPNVLTTSEEVKQEIKMDVDVAVVKTAGAKDLKLDTKPVVVENVKPMPQQTDFSVIHPAPVVGTKRPSSDDSNQQEVKKHKPSMSEYVEAKKQVLTTPNIIDEQTALVDASKTQTSKEVAPIVTLINTVPVQLPTLVETAKSTKTPLSSTTTSASKDSSKMTVPSTTVPSTTVQSTTLPSTTLPSKTLPSTTVPSTTVPSTTVPVLKDSIPLTPTPSMSATASLPSEEHIPTPVTTPCAISITTTPCASPMQVSPCKQELTPTARRLSSSSSSLASPRNDGNTDFEAGEQPACVKRKVWISILPFMLFLFVTKFLVAPPSAHISGNL